MPCAAAPIAALLVVVPAAAAVGCVPHTEVGLHRDVPCRAEGLRFHVTYDVPEGCGGGAACGLIIDVHGACMTGEIQNNNTNVRALGRRHGFITAHPTAPPGAPGALSPLQCWGWGLFGNGSEWKSARAIAGWADEAVAALPVDPLRVHFMGFSEGGGMAWRMLASRTDLFASIVAMEACETGDEYFAPGARRVPFLLQAGWSDVYNYPGCRKHSIPKMLAAWQVGEPTVVAGDETYNRTQWLSSDGVPFDFLTYGYVADYVGLGHCFPGSDDIMWPNRAAPEFPLFGPFGCPGWVQRQRGSVASYKVGEAAVAWFIAHPKRP